MKAIQKVIRFKLEQYVLIIYYKIYLSSKLKQVTPEISNEGTVGTVNTPKIITHKLNSAWGTAPCFCTTDHSFSWRILSQLSICSISQKQGVFVSATKSEAMTELQQWSFPLQPLTYLIYDE